MLDSAGNPKAGATYPMSTAQKWDTVGGGWVAAAPVVVPAGGYLVIENRDYATSDNAALTAAGLKALPTGLTMAPNARLVNLNITDTTLMIEPGDTLELVYSYDPDGTDVTDPDKAVIDKQKLPTDMLGHELSNPTAGTYNFAPSWEREDPRLAIQVDRDPVPLAIASPVYLTPTWAYNNAETTSAGTGGDHIYNTIGAINDAGDGDADPFDGNYFLGSPTHLDDPFVIARGKARYDDLVELANSPTYKFANPGLLGQILCVGPLPPDIASEPGWKDDAATWLVKNSPYTYSEDAAAAAGIANPLDAKKVNFIDAVASAGDDPRGRARAIFDIFTTECPWKDGKDNNGNWNPLTDDLDGDGGPSPGDYNVDEADEVYAYGRITVNAPTTESPAVMAALPYVTYNDATLYRPGFTDVSDVFIMGTRIARIRNAQPGKRFKTRGDFLANVIVPALDQANVTYNPTASIGAFGRDLEDNNIFQFGAGLRRVARPYEWDTVQAAPRTACASPLAPPPMFILPGEANDGGDLLIDDKTEIDTAVGALMNNISLSSDLPQEFSAAAGPGIVTYYLKVQITDGRDVDGIDGNGPAGNPTGDPAKVDANEPDWAEGTVIAEKKIIAVVDTSMASTDPRRITLFNWSTEGNYTSK